MKYKFKNGSVKVMQTDKSKGSFIPEEEVKLTEAVVFASFSRIANPVISIEFFEGRCAKYSKNISPSLSLNITITARKIKVNGIEHKNNPHYRA